MRFIAGVVAAVVFFLPMPHKAVAQDVTYKWDAGGATGLSGYLGDYSQSNPFVRPGFRISLSGSYILDSRWSFRTMAGVSSISGTSNGIGGGLPPDAPTGFRSILGDLTLRAEFNFFAYGEGETFKRLSRWTPYIAAGAGVVVASPQGASVNVAPLMPLALGVKFRLRPRLNLSGEFSMAKSFTDGLDGKSDLYGIAGCWLKNTDWVSTLTIGITYEFGERCLACHYFD